MKNFRFDTICNINQEPHAIQRFNCACWFIGKSAVIKYPQLLSKVIISINCMDIAFSTVSKSFLLYPSFLKNSIVGLLSNNKALHTFHY